MVHTPEASARGRRISGAADRIRMLKRLRPGLSARCRGMAFVVSVATQQANAKAIRSGRKLWGCPTLATDDVEEARAWAKAQLTAPAPEA